MAKTINIIPGRSAAMSFTQALQPQSGELLINEDHLSCGPLAPFRSMEEWTQLRQSYWDSLSGREGEFFLNRDFVANIQSLRDADSIVLWVAMGVDEQLLIAWMVMLLKHIGSRAKLYVIQFTHSGQHNSEVYGVGLVIPPDFKNHPPAELIQPETSIALERLWDRVTAPSPAGLLQLLNEEMSQLPYCRSSLQRLLKRYPDHRTGLTRWDYRLLKSIEQKGPNALPAVRSALGYGLDADMVEDTYLIARLLQLSNSDLPHPLVQLSGDPVNIRTWKVVLTEAGQAVLAGQANAVELNGIDDWVLRVHLDSKQGAVWYHKDGQLITR